MTEDLAKNTVIPAQAGIQNLGVGTMVAMEPRMSQVFYTFFTPTLASASRPFTPLIPTILHKRHSPYDGEIPMHLLDGLSLLLASGLFIYLLVALLRAGRS
jgi:K+-transporting ATPase ATPase F chain